MAEGGVLEYEWLSAAIEKPRSASSGIAFFDCADLGDRHASFRCNRREHIESRRLDGAHDLVIIPAGQRRFDESGIRGNGAASRFRKRDAFDRDSGGNAGRAAELFQVAGQTVGDIHRRGGVEPNGFGSSVARLWDEVAIEQILFLRAIEIPVLG